MITFALALALLPTILNANPTFDQVQNIVGPATSGKSTLATTTMHIQNGLPVDATIYLYHWRGDDEATNQGMKWDLIPARETSGGIDVKFEMKKTGINGISFRRPEWSLWTEEFNNTLGMTNINKKVRFDLRWDAILGRFQLPAEWSYFTGRGSNFPSDASGINSFFFLQVRNDLDERTSVDVKLETRSESFIQDQTFIQEKGESSKAPLPFFFEKNATKDYVELFSFKVGRKTRKPLTANLKRCEIYPVDSGSNLVLTITSTGWSLSLYKDVRCSGKWDVQKGEADGDMYEEEL